MTGSQVRILFAAPVFSAAASRFSKQSVDFPPALL
jgi:hypothetical protein